MDLLLDAGLLAAIVTALSSITVACIGVYKAVTVQQANNLLHRELEFQAAAFTVEEIITDMHAFEVDLEKLFHRTAFDRFIMLRAWNGVTTPKRTTDFFQYREDGQKVFSYKNYKLDGDYVSRINYIMQRGSMRFKTQDIPDSGIKQIYEMEGVTESVWFWLWKRVDKETGSAALVYCSLATHAEGGLSDDEVTEAELVINQLRMLGYANQHLGNVASGTKLEAISRD